MEGSLPALDWLALLGTRGGGALALGGEEEEAMTLAGRLKVEEVDKVDPTGTEEEAIFFLETDTGTGEGLFQAEVVVAGLHQAEVVVVGVGLGPFVCGFVVLPAAELALMRGALRCFAHADDGCSTFALDAGNDGSGHSSSEPVGSSPHFR